MKNALPVKDAEASGLEEGSQSLIITRIANPYLVLTQPITAFRAAEMLAIECAKFASAPKHRRSPLYFLADGRRQVPPRRVVDSRRTTHERGAPLDWPPGIEAGDGYAAWRTFDALTVGGPVSVAAESGATRFAD